MKKQHWIVFILFLTAAACKKDAVRQPDETYNPQVNSADFTNSTNLSNPYLPFPPLTKYIYEGQTADGLERIEIQRLAATKVILGITCVTVNDKVWVGGKLVEDTDDWYAQDNAGNVWYMGEEVDNFNDDGTLKDHAGSWEAGVDGAKPGLAMPVNPQVGLAYRQEYYFNEAEDEAEVLETGLSLTIPLGTYANCIKTHDFTDLEPDLSEHKFYAPGIGLVKEVNLTDAEEIFLIEIQE